MPMTSAQRQEIINDLVTNSECWDGEEDAKLLANMSDDKLLSFQSQMEKENEAIAIANLACNGFTDSASGKKYKLDPTTGGWVAATLENKKRETYNEDDEEDAEDGGMDEGTENRHRSHNRPLTAEEWLAKAPPEVAATFNYARQVEYQQKEQLVNQLLVNASDAEKQIHHDRLMNRSLEDLRNDVTLLAKTQPKEEEVASHRAFNHFKPKLDDDALEVPTMNWEGVDGQPKKKQGTNLLTNSGNDYSGMTEEEYLQNAPESIRKLVSNAASVENREKMKIIDQLVANISDEHEENQVTNTLKSKSLAELRTLLAIVPKTSQQRFPNFAGASAPAATRNYGFTGNFNPNEDVLPLPQCSFADEKTA